jgi:hypothetical protein
MLKSKSYPCTREGLNHAIKERREQKKRNIMILSLSLSVVVNFGLALINPVAGTAGLAEVITEVVAFKPF